MSGNILLTTGSKELDAFALPQLIERCVPRVLPAAESIEKCLGLGFLPAKTICMQGPFSLEMNIATIRQYDIQIVVTKLTGDAGGFFEKVQAAQECGCELIVIGRPTDESGYSFDEVKKQINSQLT
jgi:precorrin-6A/cobalt-precorrin-6A reductase